MLSRRSRLPFGVIVLAFAALLTSSCGIFTSFFGASKPKPTVAAPPPPPPQLTDPQIAQIVYAAGETDIKAARLALRQSQNPQVRSFATEMIHDHSAVNRKALALLKKLQVKPEGSDTNRTIQAEADEEYAKLSALHGPEFNKAYADNEVAYHREVNAALEDLLIPQTQDPALKGLLDSGLKIFQDHEQMAEQLAAGLH
jgi:putative membrane protein